MPGYTTVYHDLYQYKLVEGKEVGISMENVFRGRRLPPRIL